MSAARLHPNDVRRVVRALEIFRLTGRTQSEQAALDAQRGDGPFDARIYAIDWPRDVLYARIGHRVEEMLNAGLVDEVQRLMQDAEGFSTAAQAIGYKEVAAALRGECTLPEAVENTQTSHAQLCQAPTHLVPPRCARALGCRRRDARRQRSPQKIYKDIEVQL